MCGFTPSGSRAMLTPSTTASPDVGGSTPASMRSVVVLPAPSGPTMPNNSPGATSKVTRSTAIVSPKWRDRSRTSMAWAGVSITSSVRLLIEQCDVGGNTRLERESLVGDDLHLHGIHELHALLVGLHVARCELGFARDVHDAAVERD